LGPRGHRAVIACTQIADVTFLENRTELATILGLNKHVTLLKGVSVTTFGSARGSGGPRGDSAVHRAVLLVALLHLLELGTGLASLVGLEEYSALALGGTRWGITILAGKRTSLPRTPLRDHAILRAGTLVTESLLREMGHRLSVVTGDLVDGAGARLLTTTTFRGARGPAGPLADLTINRTLVLVTEASLLQG
jgi:hypothetical protein